MNYVGYESQEMSGTSIIVVIAVFMIIAFMLFRAFIGGGDSGSSAKEKNRNTKSYSTSDYENKSSYNKSKKSTMPPMPTKNPVSEKMLSSYFSSGESDEGSVSGDVYTNRFAELRGVKNSGYSWMDKSELKDVITPVNVRVDCEIGVKGNSSHTLPIMSRMTKRISALWEEFIIRLHSKMHRV